METSHPAESMSVTDQMARFVADLSYSEIPESVVLRTKHLVIDAVGCALVGTQLPWSKVAIEAMCSIDSGNDASIWGTGRSSSAGTAAVLNGSLVQSFELDDYYELGPIHSGSIVVPALLGAIEGLKLPISGEDVVTAAVAGFEVGPRLGEAFDGYELLHRGWHCGPIYGVIAAAATASRVLRLDERLTSEAFGIAGTQAAGLMSAQFEAMVKRMHHGFASRGGLQAAVLASRGYTGIRDVMERPYGGMIAMFNPDTANLSAALDGLRKTWKVSRINVKPYAAMAGLHPAIDAAIQLRSTEDFYLEDITRLKIEMPLVPFEHGGWMIQRPTTEIGAQMNVAYVVAAALLSGEVLRREFTPEMLESGELWDIIDRIDVAHSVELDAYAKRTNKKRVTRLTAEYRQGPAREFFVDEAKGQGSLLLSNSGVLEKFYALMDDVIPRSRATAIVKSALDLENSHNQLISLLAAPTL